MKKIIVFYAICLGICFQSENISLIEQNNQIEKNSETSSDSIDSTDDIINETEIDNEYGIMPMGICPTDDCWG